MKICLAQSQSIKGACAQNIQNHLQLVHQAIEQEADLILFPELSITNYEPELAEELAISLEDDLLEPFQEYSNQYQITIAVGMPLKQVHGITISLVIFQPQQPRSSYAKQQLHEDEQSFFVEGEEEFLLNCKGERIAFGICYESLQPAHLAKAKEQGATVYLASVAKEEKGMEKAHSYFAEKAAAHQIPIGLVNNVGPADSFVGVGQSAFWNKRGELVTQLGGQTGMLFVEV